MLKKNRYRLYCELYERENSCEKCNGKLFKHEFEVPYVMYECPECGCIFNADGKDITEKAYEDYEEYKRTNVAEKPSI